MTKNGFVRKKVRSLTLGEKLRQIRNERRISLNEVSKHTQIQLKYLEFLESGEYENLPAEVYVKGFLRNYANFLGVDGNYLLKLYNREQGIQKNIKKGKKIHEGFERGKLVKISNFVIISKATAIAFVAFLVVLALAYLYKEVNNFISAPRLAIFEPADGITVESGAVRVKGATDKDCEVFINGQPILVSGEGEFNEKVSLQKGTNLITVKSKNRFDKETSQNVSVQSNYEEETKSKNGGGNGGEVKGEQETKMKMEIYVNSDSVRLSVKVDGSLVYSGNLSSLARQSFKAKEEISVTSGKGSQTFIKINGEDRGALSENPGLARDVIFKAEDE